MLETIVILALAVGLHYTLEYFSDLNEIGCPTYCEVNHEHKIIKGDDEESIEKEYIKEIDKQEESQTN